MTDIRYGIFLRPDPVTCWAVTQITLAIRQQFGLVSAGAFPPHATLIGNLRTDATEDELVEALTPVFTGRAPFTVYNNGVERRGGLTYEYDVNLDEARTSPNAELGAVAADVAAAVAPLSIDVDDYLVPRVSEYRFAGHLGLASHELRVNPLLSDEIGEFIAGLPIAPAESFDARWFSLFEFRSNWDGSWWENLQWRHIRSWDIAG